MSKHTEDRLDIELSNRKEDKLDMQIQHAIERSAVFEPGFNRFEAKQNAYAQGLTGSHEVNARCKIASYASLEKFESQMHVFGRYCFGVEGCRDLNQIKPEMVTNFLTELCDRNYALNTVQSYASGLERVAAVLDAYCPAAQPRTETWHAAIDAARPIIATCDAKDQAGRAYADPQSLVAAMPSERLEIAASMQLDHGLRLGDATKINANNIDENNVLRVDNSKNGQTLYIQLSPQEAEQIKACADDNGKIIIPQSEYRSALRSACGSTGQEWQGTHGLRYNFAQDRMAELTGSGLSYEKALHKVSEEMGHHRPEITKTYLKP